MDGRSCRTVPVRSTIACPVGLSRFISRQTVAGQPPMPRKYVHACTVHAAFDELPRPRHRNHQIAHILDNDVDVMEWTCIQ